MVGTQQSLRLKIAQIMGYLNIVYESDGSWWGTLHESTRERIPDWPNNDADAIGLMKEVGKRGVVFYLSNDLLGGGVIRYHMVFTDLAGDPLRCRHVGVDESLAMAVCEAWIKLEGG